MNLTPVESSHIAAIGFLETERVLLVRYKDGALYARPGWTDIDYQRLCIAPSKGKFLAACKGPAIPIVKGGEKVTGQATGSTSGPVSSGEAAGPLNVIDENASKCCRRTLSRMFARGIDGRIAAECSQCGMRFVPTMEGPVRHWKIVEHFAVHRRV